MSGRPMAGVRVIEVAQFTFVPAAGAVLADWGADVIKVEHAEKGDAQRGLTNLGAVSAGGDFAPLMEHPNRGKRSIGLALENPEALAVLHDLVRTADVFVTNFLGDARQKLRIDVDDIRAVNPDIIYVRGTALGVHGPEANKGGFDQPTYWCRAGAAAGVTPPDLDGIIGMPGPAYGDTVGGMTIAGGIAAALFRRCATGESSVVDVSLLGVGVWANALGVDLSLISGEPWQARETSSAAGSATNPLVGLYRTADDRYLNLSMLQGFRYWPDFCSHIGRPDLVDEPHYSTAESLAANAEAAAQIIADTIRGETLAHWMAKLATLEGQWAPIQDSVGVGRDPQVRANGMIRPVVDVHGVPRELVASPVQFDEVPADLTRAPQFAEHTDEVLRELGLTDEKLIELKIAGAAT